MNNYSPFQAQDSIETVRANTQEEIEIIQEQIKKSKNNVLELVQLNKLLREKKYEVKKIDAMLLQKERIDSYKISQRSIEDAMLNALAIIIIEHPTTYLILTELAKHGVLSPITMLAIPKTQLETICSPEIIPFIKMAFDQGIRDQGDLDYKWIMDTDLDGGFSFDSCCEICHTEPQNIRSLFKVKFEEAELKDLIIYYNRLSNFNQYSQSLREGKEGANYGQDASQFDGEGLAVS